MYMIALAGLVLLAACGAPAGRLGPTQAGGATTESASSNSGAAEPTKGDPNAPVTLIEYGDYQ
jgi:hypothetical protein